MRMTASWCDPQGSTEYKVVVRSSITPDSELPSDMSSPTIASVPPCSGLSRRGLETKEREALAERRPALTAPVRAGGQHVWVGTKKRASNRTKKREKQGSENA